ncbi:HEPN domain-containing protein [Actibacterium pelagium]|uniref:Apea-like HEPN domain-containing protein n=1 Tax=Actibacterium pelagium TaxID=2029103 RepID=A0A917EL15_9RHOB|nr:HEPN domain-containing protein [Actibacterium pelagium]GGE55879.1 hypothetical protein GCM10011517_24400 [Actibacterium pelagium]
MGLEQFDELMWVERLADRLLGLSTAQKPYLQRYWQSHGFPAQITYNGEDETPFPADDLYMIYEDTRHSIRLGNAEYYSELKAALDPVRGVLRDHPVISRALGQRIDGDEVQIGILNSTTLTSLSQMIVGQMAQNESGLRDGFLQTASRLNALLLSSKVKPDLSQANNLNTGMDVALFFGLRVPHEIDLGEGYSLIPLALLKNYVDPEWLRGVAPEHVEWRRTEAMFAIIHRFAWRPYIRNKHSFDERTYRTFPPLFHRWTEEFSNLLAVALGARTTRVMTFEGCISRVASDLLGQHHGPNSPQKGRPIGHLFSSFAKFEEADVGEIERAKSLFSRRAKTDYADLAPAMYRLAEAYSRDGRFAAHDRVLDLAIVFERMFKPGNRQISKALQRELAELLGKGEEDKCRIKDSVAHFYNVRSAIIHGPLDNRKERLLREVEPAWLEGAKLAREALLLKLE